jgi:hypothetical protein
MKHHTCPTCGCPVRVVGRTTKHYEPILPDEVKELVDEAGWAEHFLPKQSAESLREVRKAVERLLEGK